MPPAPMALPLSFSIEADLVNALEQRRIIKLNTNRINYIDCTLIFSNRYLVRKICCCIYYTNALRKYQITLLFKTNNEVYMKKIKVYS